MHFLRHKKDSNFQKNSYLEIIQITRPKFIFIKPRKESGKVADFIRMILLSLPGNQE